MPESPENVNRKRLRERRNRAKMAVLMATHSTGKAVRNTVIYTAATVAQKAISFVYFFILSSNLTPAKLGAYTGMLAVASLASIGMDLGLTPLLTREAARDEAAAAEKLRAVYSIKLPLVAFTLVALWIVAPIMIDLTATETVLLAGASLIISMDAFTAGAYAILRARQNVTVESRAIIIFQCTVLVGGLAALFLTGSIVFVMAALVTGSAVNAAYTISRMRRIVLASLPEGAPRRIAPDFDRPRMRDIASRMPAFASAGIFTKVYQQADVVLLRALTGADAVGLYSIPAKVTTALQTLIPGAMNAAVYPTMSNLAHTDRDSLASLYANTFGVLFMVSLPVGIFLSILTEPILALVWPQYRSVTTAMELMLLAVPFLFLPYATGSLLLATGREKRNSANRGLMTAVSVGLNLALIPFLGVLGAATAFISANAFLLALDLYGLRGQVPLWSERIRRYVFGSSLAAVVAGSAGIALLLFVPVPARSQALLTLQNLRLFAYVAGVGTACGATYVTLVLLSKTVTRDDLAALKAMVGKGRAA